MPASDIGPKAKLIRDNVRTVKELYPQVTNSQMLVLRDMTRTLRLSVRVGDLLMLDGRWYVTHSGLLRVAQRRKCSGIKTELVENVSNPSEGRWVFKATVLKSESRSFVGYGDADPSNVSFLVHGAEMRIAETRAVNRALRKAYGIGICSVEEIGSFTDSSSSSQSKKLPPQPANGNYGGRTVRDHLCQIIRQHQLEATLVKSYATDFCGVKTLREATREQVESFVAHLADWASKDRDALLCQLNSYLGTERRCRVRRQIQGLHAADQSVRSQVRDGLFLVRVERAHHRWDARKPFYLLRFAILEPKDLTGHSVSSRLYCTPKALWKLNWFLRDFGYDVELLGRDEIDDKNLVGLRGVDQDQPCRRQRHFPAQSGWFRARWSNGNESRVRHPRASLYGRRPSDLQLHPDQPVPHLPAPLSPPLSRWLARKRYSRGHAFRARLRTSSVAPTFSGRTLPLSFSANGRFTKIRACTTRRATRGIGCFSKEFSS